MYTRKPEWDTRTGSKAWINDKTGRVFYRPPQSADVISEPPALQFYSQDRDQLQRSLDAANDVIEHHRKENERLKDLLRVIRFQDPYEPMTEEGHTVLDWLRHEIDIALGVSDGK